MEQPIRDRYTPAILDAVRRRYHIADHAIRLLDSFESHIFEFERDGEPFILRLSHSLRRSPALIYGEIDWINFLAAGGAGVAAAVASPRGRLVEPIDDDDGGQFLATAFVRAPGVEPWEAGWRPALYREYGRLIGRTHQLTKSYHPPQPEWRRPEWDHPLFDYVGLYLPQTEPVAREKYLGAVAHLCALPRGADDFGLTHQDAHGANMHVDGTGRLILFDFDDCGYHWFANDIAMCLFYMTTGRRNTPEFAAEFLGNFLQGYREENAVGDWWLAELPTFMKIREIELYAVMFRDFDVEHGGQAAIDDDWCAAFMAGRKERIETGTPWLDWGQVGGILATLSVWAEPGRI